MKFEGEAELAPCPSSAALASYIDRRDSLTERRRIVEHLARCRACVEVVTAVIQTAAAIERGEGWKA